MRALILAAGRGERMRPLTDELPKPLLSAGGQPLIEYHIRALAQAGVRELVINLSWQGDKLRRHLGDGSRFGVTIAWSEEGPVPLETGGGIHHALSLLGPEPFWVVNGDIACDFGFAPPPARAGRLAHLVLVPNPDHHPGGDFVLRDGLIVGEPADGEPRFTFAGISVLEPALFAGQRPGRFPLAPLLRQAARSGQLTGQVSGQVSGQVTGELHRGRWSDVGTPGRLRQLDSALRGQVVDGVAGRDA